MNNNTKPDNTARLQELIVRYRLSLQEVSDRVCGGNAERLLDWMRTSSIPEYLIDLLQHTKGQRIVSDSAVIARHFAIDEKLIHGIAGVYIKNFSSYLNANKQQERRLKKALNNPSVIPVKPQGLLLVCSNFLLIPLEFQKSCAVYYAVDITFSIQKGRLCFDTQYVCYAGHVDQEQRHNNYGGKSEREMFTELLIQCQNRSTQRNNTSFEKQIFNLLHH